MRRALIGLVLGALVLAGCSSDAPTRSGLSPSVLRAREARKSTPAYVICAWITADGGDEPGLGIPEWAARRARNPILRRGAQELHVGMSLDQYDAVVEPMLKECTRLKVEPH
jgi:hypothetical protein